MTNANTRDPLDDLLNAGFAAQISAQRDFDIAERLIRQISRQQKIRTLVLGAVLVVSLILGIAALMPLLAMLPSALTLPDPKLPELALVDITSSTLGATLPLVLLALFVPWFFVLLDDSI